MNEAANQAEANPVTTETLAEFFHANQPIMLGGRSQPLSVYREFARLILSEFNLQRKLPEGPITSLATPKPVALEGGVVTKEILEHLLYEEVEADIETEAAAENAYQEGYSVGFNDCRFRAVKRLHEYFAVPKPERAGAREVGFVKPDNDRQVFFYEQDFYVLSNFSAFSLRWAGDIFPTSEHVYHWEKFRHAVYDPFELQALAIRNEIKVAPSAHEAFKIAERNKLLRRSNWDYIKVNVMRNILIKKVEQHEYVRRKLLATGDRELIEDSWRDDFWGWGPNRDGKNMLGKLWMEVRAELRALSPVALHDGGE